MDNKTKEELLYDIERLMQRDREEQTIDQVLYILRSILEEL